MFKIISVTILACIIQLISLAQCDSTQTRYRKTAIVIGINEYENSTLSNPLNDAADMSDALKKLGFEVVKHTNTDMLTMETVINDWYSKLNYYDIALFYFAGHGASVEGQSFLFSSSSNPRREPDVKHVTYPVNRLLDNLESSTTRIRIVLLDACRDNPFVRGWNRSISSSGLTDVSASGTFIGFATRPGRVAADGDGRNGKFTEALLKYIKTPNISISDFFVKASTHVFEETNGRQEPYAQVGRIGSFCFNVAETPKSNASENNLATNTKSLLHRIPFHSTLGDVLAFEFGEDQRNSISYQNLTQAKECTNTVVKYYWRYLRESRLKGRINTFLTQQGLEDRISNDSYVVYVFKANKLERIDIRFFASDNGFYDQLLSSLSVNPSTFPKEYQIKVGDFHYIFSKKQESGWQETSMSISDIDGFEVCNADWWTK